MRIREFEQELEAAVVEASALLHVENDVLREFATYDAGVPAPGLPAMRSKRARLQAAIAQAAATRLLADVDDDALTLDEVDAALVLLRREVAELDVAIAEADELAGPVVDVEELRRRGGASLGSLWPEMNSFERVDALRALGADVVVSPAQGRRCPVAGRVRLRAPWLPLEPAV